MVAMHHKEIADKTGHNPLVELFRKDSLIDFSLGFFTFSIPRAAVREVKKPFQIMALPTFS